MASIANAPDVDPVAFALPLQGATGNPVTCMENSGQSLGLGYPIGIKLNTGDYGTVQGLWDVYLPLSGAGAGVFKPHGDAAPAGDYAFAGTIDITGVSGDANAINFEASFAVEGVIVKAGSGGEAQSSNVYAYVRPPNEASLITLGWPNNKTYPGGVKFDEDLDSPAGLTQGISHIEICLEAQPTLTKTLDLSWKRWQDWTLDKTVNDVKVVTYDMDVGDAPQNAQYEIVATPINQRKRFRAEGVIEVSDPLGRGYSLDAMTDSIDIDGNNFVASIGDKGAFDTFDCAAVNDASTVVYRCQYAIELSSADYPNLAAGDSVVNTADATLGLNGNQTSLHYVTPGTLFAVSPDASYGDTIAVDDDLLGANPDHTFPTDGAWTYTLPFACPDPGNSQRINTVTGTWTTGGTPATASADSSATVNVACHPRPTVDKTAIGTSTRSYTWDLEKAVTPTSANMYNGDSQALDYTVTATRSEADDSVKVEGVISIHDADERSFSVDSISDTVGFGALSFPATVGACVPDAVAGNGVIFTCPYSVTIDPDANEGTSFASGSNHVSVDLVKVDNDRHYALSFDLPFNVTAPEVTGDKLDVTDTSSMFGSDTHTFTDTGEWNYSHTATCDVNDRSEHGYSITNTVSGGGKSANASVDVQCHAVVVSKTASASYDRDYDWSADKKLVVDPADVSVTDKASCLGTPIASGTYAGFVLCDDIGIKLNDGGTYDTVYRLQATRTVQADSNFHVTGGIGIGWPAGAPVPVFSPAAPADTLHFDGGGTQSVAPACDAMGATSLSCSYDATVAGSTNGYNVAAITRTLQCYAADGTATACGSTSYQSDQVDFSFVVANETDKCANLDDLFNAGGLNLGNSFGWNLNDGDQVCDSYTTYATGDIFDGSTLLGSLAILSGWIPPAQVSDGTCKFMVPNALNVLFNGQTRNDESVVTVDVPELCGLSGCTYTQGYWKTHVVYASKPQFAKKRDNTWDLIDGAGTLDEAAPFYASGMSYIQVMWTAPKGNAYYQLAHQYIAAKLNTLAGAATTPQVASAIAQAEAMFAAHGSPSDSWWSNKTNKANAIALAGILGSYNEGSIGPGHCSVSPATLIASGEGPIQAAVIKTKPHGRR
ncbi:MAG TPA: hypothetical protein VFI26_03820 [Lysobacter sp.]|nr:hypothetical protein [Lysobacter sp.]